MEDAGETAVFLLLPEMVSLAMLRFLVDAVPSCFAGARTLLMTAG